MTGLQDDTQLTIVGHKLIHNKHPNGKKEFSERNNNVYIITPK